MKMNAKIKWLEDQKTVGESGTGHSVVMDALGAGKGVSPMEMLLLGVGGCTSIDVLSTLKKCRQKVYDFDVNYKLLKVISRVRLVEVEVPILNNFIRIVKY